MIRSRAPFASLTLRQCRERFGMLQSSFGTQLGITLETYHTWDSGRRPVRKLPPRSRPLNVSVV